MPNILTYAQTMFDTFDARPFSRVDSLVLSSLAYVHMKGDVPRLHLSRFSGAAYAKPGKDEAALSDDTDDMAPSYAGPSGRPSADAETRIEARGNWFVRQGKKAAAWLKALVHGSRSGTDGRGDGLAGPSYPGDAERFIPLADVLRAEDYAEMFDDAGPDNEDLQLLRAVCESPRYRGIQVGQYIQNQNSVNGEEQQFGAVTFLLPDGTEYIAFRGTEANILGWKEDFEMTYHAVIPSQTEAYEYLEAVAAQSGRPLRVGGHSKGGNLAVYSSTLADPGIRQRIVAVYSHDGPGFQDSFFRNPGWAEIKGKEDKSCPEFTVVGQLLNPEASYSVVKCSVSGIRQHYCMSWNVVDGDFEYAENTDPAAVSINSSISQWLEKIPLDRRKLVVGSVYEAIRAGGYEDLNELSGDFSHAWPKIYTAVKNTDSRDRSVIFAIVRDLMGLLVPSMIGSLMSPLIPPAVPSALASLRGRNGADSGSGKSGADKNADSPEHS